VLAVPPAHPLHPRIRRGKCTQRTHTPTPQRHPTPQHCSTPATPKGNRGSARPPQMPGSGRGAAGNAPCPAPGSDVGGGEDRLPTTAVQCACPHAVARTLCNVNSIAQREKRLQMRPQGAGAEGVRGKATGGAHLGGGNGWGCIHPHDFLLAYPVAPCGHALIHAQRHSFLGILFFSFGTCVFAFCWRDTRAFGRASLFVMFYRDRTVLCACSAVVLRLNDRTTEAYIDCSSHGPHCAFIASGLKFS
jgi:hypothetical protein